MTSIHELLDDLELLADSVRTVAENPHGEPGRHAVALLDAAHRQASEVSQVAADGGWPSAPMLARVVALLAEEMEIVVLGQPDGVDRLAALPAMIGLLRRDAMHRPVTGDR